MDQSDDNPTRILASALAAGVALGGILALLAASVLGACAAVLINLASSRRESRRGDHHRSSTSVSTATATASAGTAVPVFPERHSERCLTCWKLIGQLQELLLYSVLLAADVACIAGSPPLFDSLKDPRLAFDGWRVNGTWARPRPERPLLLLYFTQFAVYTSMMVYPWVTAGLRGPITPSRLSELFPADALLHHLVTLLLISGSCVGGYLEIGAVVFVLHDTSSIVLKLARVCRLAGDRESVESGPGFTKASKALFLAFAATFFLSRVIAFPFSVRAAVDFAMESGRTDATVLSFFLCSLYCLHLFWAFKIVKVATRRREQLTEKGEEKDKGGGKKVKAGDSRGGVDDDKGKGKSLDLSRLCLQRGYSNGQPKAIWRGAFLGALALATVPLLYPPLSSGDGTMAGSAGVGAAAAAAAAEDAWFLPCLSVAYWGGALYHLVPWTTRRGVNVAMCLDYITVWMAFSWICISWSSSSALDSRGLQAAVASLFVLCAALRLDCARRCLADEEEEEEEGGGGGTVDPTADCRRVHFASLFFLNITLMFGPLATVVKMSDEDRINSDALTASVELQIAAAIAACSVFNIGYWLCFAQKSATRSTPLCFALDGTEIWADHDNIHLLGVAQHILHATVLAMILDPLAPTATTTISLKDRVWETLLRKPAIAYLAACLFALGTMFSVSAWAVTVISGSEGRSAQSGRRHRKKA